MGAQAFTHLDPHSSIVPFSLPLTLPNVENQLCIKNLPSTDNLEISLSSMEPVDVVGLNKAAEKLAVDEEVIASAVNETIDEAYQGGSEQLSPATPLDKLKYKVAQSSSPWSQTLLALSKANKDSALVDSAARRSLRQKSIHNGYKGSPCSNKNCLGCSMPPQPCLPQLSGIWVPPFARLILASFLMSLCQK
jgi:hypothetical protein